MPSIARRDDAGWGKDNDCDIVATHARKLPGVICPVEQQGRCASRSFDEISNQHLISGGLASYWVLPHPSELVDLRVGTLPFGAISVDDYRALVAQSEPLTGPERLLRPSTNFGPLRGTALHRPEAAERHCRSADSGKTASACD